MVQFVYQIGVVAGHLSLFLGPEVSCTSGIMTLKWLDKNIASNFRVNQGTVGCTPDRVQCTHYIIFIYVYINIYMYIYSVR